MIYLKSIYENTNNICFDIAVKSKSVVIKIIENTKHLDIICPNGEYPMISVIKKGWKDVLKIMIDGGTNVNITNNFGDTPLIWASITNNLDMVRILIDAGANWNHKTNNNQDFLSILKNNFGSDYKKNTKYNEIIISEYPTLYEKYLEYEKLNEFNI